MNTATSFVKLIEKLRAARLAEAEALGDLAAVISSGSSTPVPLLTGSPSQIDGQPCYLSVRQLAERIPYAEQTIRNMVSSGELIEGKHYFKRRRRVMFSWPAMREGPQALPGLRQA
jgi:hypothetical protein